MQTQQALVPTEHVELRVFRANPANQASSPHFSSYNIPLEPGMTVLSALLYAKEKLDHSIAIRFSCRMASCGSCGMKINSLPRLACYTQVRDLPKGPVTVEPLDHYPLVRDLVTDFDGFFGKHRSISPYLIRRDEKEQETLESEYRQSVHELDDYLQFAYCIKCGLCNAACPTLAADPHFIGPQALGQAYRYVADSRDEAASLRVKAIDNSHGIWRCHFAGACSYVCPKGVDPAFGIQKLRRIVFSHAQKKSAELMARRQLKS